MSLHYLLCAASLAMPFVWTVLVIWSVIFVALSISLIKDTIDDWKAYKNNGYEEINSQEEEA